jgi:hypothetical protein
MARKLDGQPPLEQTRLATKYPWDEWTDGDWWEITQGEDFTSEPSTMVSVLHNHAGRHQLQCEAHRRGNTIVFKLWRS